MSKQKYNKCRAFFFGLFFVFLEILLLYDKIFELFIHLDKKKKIIKYLII